MRILTVANHLGARGGLERTQLTNCRALAARGHRVDLVYQSEGDFADDWRAFTGTMTKVRGTLPRRSAPLSSTAGVLAGLRTARRAAADVVYVYRYWDVPFAVAIAARTGASVVFHLCLPPPRVTPAWLRPFLARVDATLAVSADTARRWQGSGLRAEATRVVLTGIDLATYAPGWPAARAATRGELGLTETAFVVLYAGRLGREKGVDVLVRAFAALVERVRDAHLVVIGSASLGADPGDSERYLRELHAVADGLPVTWMPARQDVVPLIQAADVAVVPSLWPEPLARAVMEPLACGVPVVASRVGGNPEILSDWLATYLFEPGDAAGLADLLCGLDGWRAREPQLGARCREVAVTRLALDHEVDEIEKAFEEVAARRGQAASRP